MARYGFDRRTGRPLSGWEHCAQSIEVIVTTVLASRGMLRDFGSAVRDLQDRNPDPMTLMALFVAVAEALLRWEPGYRLASLRPERLGVEGVGVLVLDGTFYERGHLGDYSGGQPATYRSGRLVL
jgi:phage baseplate assembly protein W